MPISEKSIIDAGQVASKSPLKKTTVAWAIGIVMGLAVIGYYAPKLKSSATKIEVPPDSSTTKNSGSEKQIEAEFVENAAKEIEKAKKAAAKEAAAQATGAGQPDIAAKSPLPKDVHPILVGESDVGDRKDLHGRAAFGRDKRQSKDDSPELEMDSLARVSKSMAVDYSGGNLVDSVKDAGGEMRTGAAQSGSQVPVATNTPTAADKLAQLISAQTTKTGSSDPSREWLKEYTDLKPSSVITPKKVKSRYTLIQGKVIPAVLGKSLNSDLPGDITAFTTVDIYDSLTSQYLLIPKGSMLIGEYSNKLRAGQSRLMFAFSRIVLPNGVSFDLPGNKGQDQMGVSGIEGDVNNHYFARFTSGFLIAYLADRLEGKSTQPVTNIGATGPSTAAGQVLSELAKADLARTSDMPATIKIEEGTRINVQVSADMEFPSAYRKL